MTSQADDGCAVEVDSPVCSMREADDVYMGYAGKEELTGFLNELLEAERAAAQVSFLTACMGGSGQAAGLLSATQRDSARWRAMLLHHLKTLGAEPSQHVRTFYDKPTANGAVAECIAFLNRSRSWEMRRLRGMLSRVRDDRLHADLTELLRSHEANITMTDDVARRSS